MGEHIAAAAALSTVGLFMLAVLVQPGSAWREAAEHAKVFWFAWAEASVGAGLAVPAIWGLRWPTIAWLSACCGFAVLQPALVGDFIDVRRHVRSRRTIVVTEHRRAPATVSAPGAPTGATREPEPVAAPSREPEPEPVVPGPAEPAPIQWRAPDPEEVTREVPATLSRPEGG